MATTRFQADASPSGLTLTVTNGPATSTYRIRKSTPPAQVAEILRSVAQLLDPAPRAGQVPYPRAAQVDPRPAPIVDTIEPEDAPPAARPMTEEESLAALKEMAYNMAVRNAKFAEDEDLAARVAARLPEQRSVGDRAGLPELQHTGQYAVTDYREKPVHNIVNHED